MSRDDLLDRIPTSYQKPIYQNYRWKTRNEWIDVTGGHPDKFKGIYYIIFSTRFLRYDSTTNWDLFSIVAIRYGDTIVLKDFFHMDTFKYDPNLYDVLIYSINNDYLYGLPRNHMYFISGIENHDELTSRIVNIAMGRERVTCQPFSEHDWL